jgi:transcriptional regulatory protein AMDR
LLQHDQLKYLWMSVIYTLFTTVLQISVELRFSNPVLAVNAHHRFDIFLSSIRKMAEYWDEAQLLLQMLESSPHIQHAARLGARTEGLAGSSPAVENTIESQEQVNAEVVEESGHPKSGSSLGGTEGCQSNSDVQDDWDAILASAADGTNEGFGSSDILSLDAQWWEMYWQGSEVPSSMKNLLWGWSIRGGCFCNGQTDIRRAKS